jgi:hypothetical protein
MCVYLVLVTMACVCVCRYDHIVPFYGVCSTNTARSAGLLLSDAVTMSSDYTVRKNLVCRTQLAVCIAHKAN